ncbi:o-succinylbenzoate synthase [Sansalvadorimonas sp. 2012CJ34-2]|uniref:o-succinylbenzoate synthase n=1 Tax=Parendozoicomonas callyspongiae TaxID=2942213 RepID=A0ABT0PDJ2_9GAMM|nr:o-succinylbenzoate synthase [Sansalvadorimonas sp. 2012CJ34-2]MCL6269439.1 o-succinylbenzoate synthase [Sansalvadorimonas sp. 2012CJ34-2]
MLKAVSVAAYSLKLEGSLPGCPPGVREGLLLKLEDSNGYLAYGDCAPLPGFSCETLDIAQRQLIDYARWLAVSPGCLETVQQQGMIATAGKYSSSVAFAVESAASQLLHSDYHTLDLPPCALLSGSNEEIVGQTQALDVNSSLTRIKIKVARQSVAQDIELFQMLDKLLPEQVKIRVDANRGWSWCDAMAFAKAIDPGRISRMDFIEEPLTDQRLLPDFAEQSNLPIALDESLQGHYRMPELFTGLNALVVKPTLAGGVLRCRRLAQLARENNLQLVVSSSYESNIGIDFLTELAGQQAPETAPGLDTLSTYRQWLIKPPAVQSAGHYPVSGEKDLKILWSSHE